MSQSLKCIFLFGALILGLSNSAATTGVQGVNRGFPEEGAILESGGIYTVPPDGSCGKYEISFAPGGHNLMAWHPVNRHILLTAAELAGDYTIATFDADCLLSGERVCGNDQFYVTSPTIHTIYWAADGRTLFVINADGLLFKLVIENGQVTEKRLVGKVAENPFGRASFGIAGPTTAFEGTDEGERLKRSLSDQPSPQSHYRKSNLVISGSAANVLIGERSDDLQLELSYGNGAEVETGVLASFTGQDGGSLPLMLQSASGQNWLVGANNLSPIQVKPKKNLERKIIDNFTNGSWPIIDTDTGLLIGIHDEQKMAFFAVNRTIGVIQEKLEAETRRLSGSIMSISISSRAERVAFSVRRLGQGVISEVYDAKSDKIAVVQSCGTSTETVVPIVKTWDGGNRNWPLPIRLYRGAVSKNLIIYLHGGPASSSNFDPAWARFQDVLNQGYDVITIDPSGSTNSVAIARRLGEGGGAALETDAILAANQIDMLSGKYNHVSMLAESFGGAWAPALYRHLKRKPERVVLAAPLLSYIPPAKREGDGAKALKDASLYDDVMAMPMKADTFVGDMGSALSGGQKQRLLIARALYRRPAILLMDEATSHLDVRNETAINRALKTLEITRVVFAHRIETLRAADKVYDMASGKFIEKDFLAPTYEHT